MLVPNGIRTPQSIIFRSIAPTVLKTASNAPHARMPSDLLAPAIVPTTLAATAGTSAKEKKWDEYSTSNPPSSPSSFFWNIPFCAPPPCHGMKKALGMQALLLSKFRPFAAPCAPLQSPSFRCQYAQARQPLLQRQKYRFQKEA